MKNQNKLPLGEKIILKNTEVFPEKKLLDGKFVSLLPVKASRDFLDLYNASHGNPEKEGIWTYMLNGSFEDSLEMKDWLKHIESSEDPLFFSVLDKKTGKMVGIVSFLNIVPTMQRLELGHIWFSPSVQKTKTNTESIYLMLRNSFEVLNYRRIEWKCDSLNKGSREAALRLGFKFEGVFKQHMIVKGRTRDTAWYAMINRDWERIRNNMINWLYNNENSYFSLTSLNLEFFPKSQFEMI